MAKLSPDSSKWSVLHEFIDEKDVVRARLTVDGSWIDTQIRRIANPVPPIAVDVMNAFPKLA